MPVQSPLLPLCSLVKLGSLWFLYVEYLLRTSIFLFFVLEVLRLKEISLETF
jgi:hypothetical protein